jgi:hypothetical protein
MTNVRACISQDLLYGNQFMEARPYFESDWVVPSRLADLPVTAATDEDKWKAIKAFKRKAADSLASLENSF